MTSDEFRSSDRRSQHASGEEAPGDRLDVPSPEQDAGPVEAEVVSEEESVTQRLEEAEAQARSHLDDARRIKAEFDNYKKRMLREQTGLVERAASGLIERTLPILDSFKLALIAADRTKDYEALVRGVELVYGEIVDLFQKEGLEEIEAEGKPFDPELHEAVIEAEGGKPDGDPYVVDVLRTGYRLKGRVLRPAMVKVERR